jgi:hypothetical protein
VGLDEYAEAWGHSFSDKDARPGALAQTPPSLGADTRTADEIVLPALLASAGDRGVVASRVLPGARRSPK